MKERIINKLDERIELILNKNVEEITGEEYLILKTKLNDIIIEETQEKRDKNYAEIMAKLLER